MSSPVRTLDALLDLDRRCPECGHLTKKRTTQAIGPRVELDLETCRCGYRRIIRTRHTKPPLFKRLR